MAHKVVAHMGEISPEWLTDVLSSTGRLKSKVVDVQCEQIGSGVGLMAELGRLNVTYAGDEDLPSTMISKCAARNENRAVAQLLDFYNREANFYNKVAPACPFRVPQSYFAAVESENYDLVLLMEDLGDVSPIDQITGSSESEAFDKVERIAGLHAKYWNRVYTPENSWMYQNMADEVMLNYRDYVYGPALEPAIEKFASHFDDESEAIVRKVGKQYADVHRNIKTAHTFIHGDYRQDNFIYQGDSEEPVIMDWQISGTGPGMFDVTYFICQSLQVDLRKQIERPLVEHYVKTLAALGVTDYSFNEAWADYRQLILFCLIYPITVCGSLDTGNERGRALAECMLDRNLSALHDLGAAELLD